MLIYIDDAVLCPRISRLTIRTLSIYRKANRTQVPSMCDLLRSWDVPFGVWIQRTNDKAPPMSFVNYGMPDVSLESRITSTCTDWQDVEHLCVGPTRNATML